MTEQEYIIFNVCIVPDTRHTATQRFVSAAVALSRRLHRLWPGYYSLQQGEIDEYAETTVSAPHCTLMHVRLPKSEEAGWRFLQALQPLIGRQVYLATRGVEHTSAAALDRDALEGGYESEDTRDVARVRVNRNQPLTALQADVALHLSAWLDEGVLATGEGERYQPHILLHADTPIKEPRLLETSFWPRPPELRSALIRGRVAIGTMGRTGQMREHGTAFAAVERLVRQTLSF